MKVTRMFYLMVAASLIIGVVVMFAVDLAMGALITVIDLAAMGFVYLFFFRTLMKNERLAETGVPARARVVAARYTGTVVNDVYKQYDFTLEILPEEGEPYEARTRGLVPIEDVHLFDPGRIISVMVNPDNPTDVAIGDGGGELGNLATTTPLEEQRKQIEAMLERNEKKREEIHAKGLEAEAVILKAFELGINVNGPNPAMQFLLEVKPEGKEAFQAETMGVIDEAAVGKYQAGKTITVKYDPDDLTRVALFHSGGKGEAPAPAVEVTLPAVGIVETPVAEGETEPPAEDGEEGPAAEGENPPPAESEAESQEKEG
ncbi:MAG: DUF3592 domain-containing protein [Actinomycetota bacterium]